MPQPRRSSTFAICLPAISSYCSCPWLAPGIDSRKTRRIRAENFGSTGYSGAWAGLFNTHFWVDPASGVCGSIYSNFVPFGPPEALELYANFELAVYSSR